MIIFSLFKKLYLKIYLFSRDLILILFLSNSYAFASESTTSGKGKAIMCSSCHGKDGISNTAHIPNLAGQKKDYLVKQLKDYQLGLRNDPVMSGMAVPLTATDINDLANYYSDLTY